MFGNMFRRMEVAEYLDKLKKELEPSNPSKDACDQCTFCCHARPGCLDKDDVKNLAKHFNLTEKEVFSKYLAVDDLREYLCLLPIRKGQEDLIGEYIPSDRTFDKGECIFLKNKNCELHDSAKPIGCRETNCKTDKKAFIPEWNEEELKELGWDGDMNDL